MVKDPPYSVPSVPGVLGMNIIKECYSVTLLESLLNWGGGLQHRGEVKQSSTVLYKQLKVQTTAPPDRSGCVKVKGGRVCRVPGGTMKIVAATCSQHLADDALFEPLSTGLSAGLLASPALLGVTGGPVYIPVVSVGTQDVVLGLQTVLGAHLVSLPQGLEEREVSATVSSPSVTSSVQDKIAAVDLTPLA